MLLYCLPACIISYKKNLSSLPLFLYIECQYFQAAFKISSFTDFEQIYFDVCLCTVVFFSCFLCLGFSELLFWICGFIVFIKFGEILAIIFYIFVSVPSPCPLF